MNGSTVNIFIASSIVEFADMRDDIENFIWRLRDGQRIDVVPVRCETADPSMSATRKEDDYCELIRRSNICLFLFDKKLGAYSLEEYNFVKSLKKSGGGPQVLVFFRGNFLADFRALAEEDGFEVYSFDGAEDVCAALAKKLTGAPALADIVKRTPVNIFFASSIKDDERQRIRIENFIWKMNYEFVNAYGISVRPLLHEGVGTDEVIKSSRMCFFIVFTRVDNEVRGELEFAKKYFDSTGYPKIYVYFNTVADGSGEEQSVADFKNYLDRELNHFYGTFSGIDTIKLRILLNLAIQEAGSKEVSFKDGKCFFGQDALFAVDNVSEFANNKKLAALKAQFSELSESYHLKRRNYENNRADKSACEEYYEVASQYISLRKKIEELEESIFSVAVSMSHDEVHGLITEKQKKAYRYFEAGDVEAAVDILDIDETLRGYDRAARLAKNMAMEAISEGRLKIEFLRTMYQYKERYQVIEHTYEKLLPVASAQQIGLNIYNEYALFLLERDRHREALEKARLLQTLYTIFPAAGGMAERADNLTVLASVCAKMSDMQRETEEYSLSSLTLREKLYAENAKNEANNAGIAETCLALGNIYRRAQRTEEAERYLARAEEIFKKLSATTQRYIPEEVKGLILKGQTYFDRFMPAEALSCYGRAEELMRTLPLKSPEEKYQLSSCYQNSAAMYRKMGKKQEALEMFSKSREIRLKLADEDPAGYMPALAYSCQGVGNACRSLGRKEEALGYYRQAYGYRKIICEKNSNAHAAELSDSCTKIAGVLLGMGRADEALPYIEEAYAIRERLFNVSPHTYLKWFAQIVFEYGRYYEQKGQIAKAEEYYNRALELRTSGDVQIAPNAQALHDSFTKMKELYGKDYVTKLSPKARAVHDALYSYNSTHPKSEQIVLDSSYDD